jgi:hypothetical protein
MISEGVRDDATGFYAWQEDGVGFSAPSVTTILSPLNDFSKVPPDRLEWARERGQAVHAVTAMYDEGTLDPSSVHPIIQRFLDGWVKFRADTGFVPLWTEAFVRSKKYGYAGRLDRIGYLPAGERWPECHVIADLKTGATIPISLGPQVAAYRQAAIETFSSHPMWEPRLPLLRASISFDEDREPDFKFLEDPMDWEIFMSCRNIFHYVRRKR